MNRLKKTFVKIIAVGFALLIVLMMFSGCGISEFEDEKPNFPTDQEKTADPLQQVELSHLEFFNQFDLYNQSVDSSGGFVLSETEQDDVLYYKFENTVWGVTILVPPADDSASPPMAAISYQGKSLSFEMPVFVLGYGLVSGSASLHLEDLTGDGSPELIYIYGGGGTGAWNDTARVFDLSSMTECTVSWDNTLLQAAISLQSVGIRDESAIFAVTNPDGEIVYGAVYYGGDSLPKRINHSFGGYETLSLENGQLLLTSSFTADIIPNHPDASYLGSLTVPLVYNSQNGSFSLSDAFSLTVFEPVDSDLISDIEPSFNPAEQAALLAYHEVLQEQRSIQTGYEEEYLSMHPDAVSTMPLSAFFHDWAVPNPRFSAAAFCDLDSDGIREVILRVAVSSNTDLGFLILHYEHEIVYGYFIYCRAFDELKIDGTFSTADGVFRQSISTISFEENKYTTVPVTYSYPEDLDQQVMLYFEHDNNISKEEFESILEAQSQKPSVSWCDFSPDIAFSLLEEKIEQHNG